MNLTGTEKRKLQQLGSFSAALLLSLTMIGAPAIAGEKVIDWEKDKKLAKARQLMDTNNVEEAVKILEEQLKKYPAVGQLHCDLGKCYKKRGKLTNAHSEFKRATEVDPNYAESWYELGAIYESDRDWQLAVDSFERFLSLAPFHEKKNSVKDRINFCKSKM